MSKKKQPIDFVKWLQGQLKAFRACRFEELDVEVLGDELESVVGKCRHEVRDRAKRLFRILMRREYVYGDWNDLQFEWDMLRSALKDSPSLVKTAQAQIKRAYPHARVEAHLHGEGVWPAKCPWLTLEALRRAVRARYREYLTLEQQGDPDFGALRPIPRWGKSRSPGRSSTSGKRRSSARAVEALTA